MLFSQKVEFCRALPIEKVCRDIGNVDFRGNKKTVASPLRQGSKKNSFSIDVRHNVFTDWGFPVSDNPKRGVAAGDPIDFVRYMFGYNFQEAVNYLWNYYNGGRSSAAAKKVVITHSEPVRHEAPDLNPEDLDKAYKIFLELSTLDARSKDALTERNLSYDEIQRYGLRLSRRELLKASSIENFAKQV
jgi:hypothetical protein